MHCYRVKHRQKNKHIVESHSKLIKVEVKSEF